jgi:Domain of unknown function DUF11
MIDISGRAVRAGIRSITAVAAVSCFAVMPQVTSNASAHTGGKAARAARGHDLAGHKTTPYRDHNGREGRDRERGRANLVVDTHGPRGAIVPGRTYKWPFEVTNRGTVPAKDVALTATPDRSLKVLAAPPKCRWRKTGPLVCKIGLLPQGQTRRGTITAEVAPRAHTGKSLNNPVQVSWRNAPRQERRMSAFPPVEVSPDTDASATAPGDGKIPYPLTVTEHAPVTAESVVVRSPIGLPAPEGPCANGVAPSKIAGKSMPIKPALGPCGAKLDDPTACGCGATHDRPVVDGPPADAVPDEHAGVNADVPDRPVAAPCGAARPVVTPDRPAVPVAPPCAHGAPADEPPAEAGTDLPATTPCDAGRPVILPSPVRPVVVPDRPGGAPCAGAQGWPGAAQERPVEADAPATAPCGAAVPVIRPERPVVTPDTPCAAAAKAAEKAAAEKAAAEKAAADKAAAEKAAAEKAQADKAAAEKAAADKAAAEKAEAAQASVPTATTPCGAAASNPVLVPDRPVIVPEGPAIPPCALGRPAACGCVNAEHAPAAPAAAPALPALPDAPGVSDAPGAAPVAPCAAADKPMAVEGKAVEERPAGPSCGAAQEAPAAVHEEPAATPDTVAPMTPLAGPGKAAHLPHGRPHHHAGFPARAPLGSGRAHRDCVRQGTGFVCPLGSAPHRRPHVYNLTAPRHPHAIRCGAGAEACHTREARPVAMRPQPVRGNLPVTGGSSALLALSGLGLAGAGVVLYRLGRTRRGEQG